MKKIRIGAGAGYSGDRIEPSAELAQKGDIDYLVYECLAERTIALAQQSKMKNPSLGYDPLLRKRMQAVLALCHDKKIKIITNMGAANPLAAMQAVREEAQNLGLQGFKLAAVTGDDVLEQLMRGSYQTLETNQPLNSYSSKIISANAYLGAQGIIEALQEGADVVITGRVADPSLFLAPMVFEFGWSLQDWNMLGKATCLGHLLECAGQITGGYFSDPGYKDVDGLAKLGFPLAEVSADGSFFISKVPGSGGAVNAATCKEQLLYELHDPKCYLTPDVTADFSQVAFSSPEPDKVIVTGATGRPAPQTLKVSVGYLDSYAGEGQISYAGPGAMERGRQALEIVKQRFALCNLKFTEEKYELIGVDSLHGAGIAKGNTPYEVRVRVVCRCEDEQTAVLVGNEVETLYTNGPYGGGGATKAVRQIVGIVSTLFDRELVQPVINYEVI